jgi:hypothetical protein
MRCGCRHTDATGPSPVPADPRPLEPAAGWEVADIVRLHGEAYARAHPLTPPEREVLDAIVRCRTPALGGHLERCDACGFQRPAYNSCRNRHCPKCQTTAKLRWLEARRAELLPVPYFHVVFTLPHALNRLARANKRQVYDLLFHAAADTLKTFGCDPKHLGGTLGLTAILHTWDQQLRYHVHLHCVVAGGALAPDGASWLRAREEFLFPVRALSRVFRGKCLDALAKSFARGELARCDRVALEALVARLWKSEWVVYAKRPFAGPRKVLDYLGRYTHRVAIANHRILAVEDGRVTFRYRDRRDHDRLKTSTLGAEEFLRRFLLHVLPKGYQRIRHYGFLANRRKGTGLARCRRLLGLPPDLPAPPDTTTRQLLLDLAGIDPTRCPACGRGTLRIIGLLPPLGPLDTLSPPPTPHGARHPP